MGRHTDEQAHRVGIEITKAIADFKAASPSKRHPAEVTADRLGEDLWRYGTLMSGEERDAVSTVRFLLMDIAEGRR